MRRAGQMNHGICRSRRLGALPADVELLERESGSPKVWKPVPCPRLVSSESQHVDIKALRPLLHEDVDKNGVPDTMTDAYGEVTFLPYENAFTGK